MLFAIEKIVFIYNFIILKMEFGENLVYVASMFLNSICIVSIRSVPEWASSRRTKARKLFEGHPILKL